MAIPIYRVGYSSITHPFAAKKTPVLPQKIFSARLACVRHAASVHPEPGSNSPKISKEPYFRCLVFKVQSTIPTCLSYIGTLLYYFLLSCQGGIPQDFLLFQGALLKVLHFLSLNGYNDTKKYILCQEGKEGFSKILSKF